MILAAQQMGVLSDGHGIPCPICDGECSLDVDGVLRDCDECEGQGRLYPDGKEIEAANAESLDYVRVIRFLYLCKERPMFATEWLDQPYILEVAANAIGGVLHGEFEDRRAKLRNAENS